MIYDHGNKSDQWAKGSIGHKWSQDIVFFHIGKSGSWIPISYQMQKSIPGILNVKSKTFKILKENIRNYPNDLEHGKMS